MIGAGGGPVSGGGGGAPPTDFGVGATSWNATTNTPALADGVGSAGDLYRVGTAGSTSLDGITDWEINDLVWFDDIGGVWRKIDNTEPTSLPPTAHGTSHTDGSDDIQDATASQKGLATAAQITKLDALGLATVADPGDAGAIASTADVVYCGVSMASATAETRTISDGTTNGQILIVFMEGWDTTSITLDFDDGTPDVVLDADDVYVILQWAGGSFWVRVASSSDPNLTADEKAALAGSSGTPSASNKYLTEDDDATVGTPNKLARMGGGGTLNPSILPTATQSSAGKIEIATDAECLTGDGTRAMSPGGFQSTLPTQGQATGGTDTVPRSWSSERVKQAIESIAPGVLGGWAFDFGDARATGDGALYLPVPKRLAGHDITSVEVWGVTAGAVSGSCDVQVARIRGGTPVDVLSTLVTMAFGDTYADDGIVNTANDDLAAGDILRIDVDGVCGTPGNGLAVIVNTEKP